MKPYLFRNVISRVAGVSLRELAADGQLEITPKTEGVFESQLTADGIAKYRGVIDPRMTVKMKFAQLSASIAFVRRMQFEQIHRALQNEDQPNVGFQMYCPAEDTEIISNEIVFTTLMGLTFGQEFNSREVEFELPDGLTQSRFNGVYFDRQRPTNTPAIPL